MDAAQALLCNNRYSYSYSLVAATRPFNSRPSISNHPYKFHKNREIPGFKCRTWPWPTSRRPLILLLDGNGSNLNTLVCHMGRRKPPTISNATVSSEDSNDNVRKPIQTILWVLEGVYILWLFLLPYAPVSTLHFAFGIFSQCLLSCHVLSQKGVWWIWLKNNYYSFKKKIVC